jgi:hypothetical protein
MTADAADGGAGRLRPWRWIGAAALGALVAWHTLFDISLFRGMREYLDGQARQAAGTGPAVTIHGVMDAAARRGAWWGLAAAAVVLAVAAGLYRAVEHRRARLRQATR